MSGKPDSAAHPEAESDAAKTIIAHLNEVTGSAFKPVESNLRLVRGRLGEGYTAEEIRAVIDAKRAEWFGNPRWGKYLRPATLFNATNFAQYAGQLSNVVMPEDGRVDLGNGRYRLNGRIFGADGRPEVVL
ncbi:hypothetical protein AGI3411_03689 [Achromobacter agilis]|uniref:Phage conserved hypothetical protein C-terminal domain-containing protein n=1 Tax=Achromobacter agilis TaxID=1353888 RepID=A0A446CKU0_9BURK|nr:hypothetical protein JL37_11255 [Achromobacter sp. RTa]SSW68499.1 hypothetical protein AGI3411_03689 [Achromobacter agilis]